MRVCVRDKNGNLTIFDAFSITKHNELRKIVITLECSSSATVISSTDKELFLLYDEIILRNRNYGCIDFSKYRFIPDKFDASNLFNPWH